MIDYARITVKSGDGGNGAGSFFHIKGKRYGKADGGDGGNGGNVLLQATRDLNTLEPFRYIKDYKAKNGANGFSNHKRGADGEDLVIKVPVGTSVKVTEGQRDKVVKGIENASASYDLAEDGQRALIARGGRGGRGNSKLRDEFGRRPRAGEPGEEGETCQVVLELKLIADVGLIGLPNAGKSTLLAALTKATPKIADYPFTTLEPNLGVMSESSVQGLVSRPFVLADIPGLIEGASKGKGLGDLFLRHIQRTKVLVHLLDVSDINSNIEYRNSKLWNDYQTVRNELKVYSKDLAKKKEIVVFNKIDQVEPEDLKNAIEEFAAHRKKVIAISAKEGIGLAELRDLLFKIARKR